MVSHNDMDAVGESEFVSHDVEQEFVRKTTAMRIFGAAVDNFLENDVPVGIVPEVGVGEDAFKIAAMSVEVACYKTFSISGEVNDISPSEFVCDIGVPALFEQFDNFSCHLGGFHVSGRSKLNVRGEKIPQEADSVKNYWPLPWPLFLFLPLRML